MSPIHALALVAMALSAIATGVWLSRRIAIAIECLSEPDDVLPLTADDLRLASDELRGR